MGDDNQDQQSGFTKIGDPDYGYNDRSGQGRASVGKGAIQLQTRATHEPTSHVE